MEKMKRFRYVLILIFLLPYSCIKDNSTFGGAEIDEITIEGIDDRMEIEIGSSLKVQPVVKTKFGDRSDISYVWYKYNGESVIADTLSFEKDLDVVIADVLPGVATTLVLKVTDNTNGIFAMHKSIFTTVGSFSGGTLMICLNGTEYDLAMLKKDGVTLYDNIYSQANNGEKLSSKSTRLFFSDGDARNTPAFRAVIAAANDETGGVYLDPTILTRIDYMRDKFTFPEDMPATIDIMNYYVDQMGDYLIVNGQVYNRPNINAGGRGSDVDWYPPAVVLSEPSDYSMATYAALTYTSGAPMFYDNNHGRMLYTTNGGSFSFLSGSSHDTTYFDPNNMGEGVVLVLAGVRNSNANDFWALMKDTGRNEYFVITYRRISSFISQSLDVLPATSYPELYAATALVPGTKTKTDTQTPWRKNVYGIKDFFFYVSGNKVYAFNVVNLSGGVIIDGDTENFTITGIDCTQIPDNGGDFVQLTLTVQGSGSGKQGGIAAYRLSSIGGLTATKLFVKTGFCDEVVATMERH